MYSLEYTQRFSEPGGFVQIVGLVALNPLAALRNMTFAAKRMVALLEKEQGNKQTHTKQVFKNYVHVI